MKELTKTRTVDGKKAEIGSDDDLVRVKETIKLNEDDMKRIVGRLADGRFDGTSENGRWEKIKEIGLLIEKEETIIGF